MDLALILSVLASIGTAWWIGYSAGYKKGYNQCLTDDYRKLYEGSKEWEFTQKDLN